jgi:hypothetical protein
MAIEQIVPSPERRPVWHYLLSIIDRPRATFEAVVAQRKWWVWVVPLLIVLLCFGVVTAVSAPYSVEIARQQAEQQLNTMPPEQAEAARASIGTFTSLPFILATGLAVGALLLILGMLAQAAVLYFGALVTGGEVNFGPVFTMSVWSHLPMAIGFLTQAAFTAIAGRAIRYPGLAGLVASGDLTTDSRNPLVALLGRVDLFWLWHLLLVMIGLTVVARFSRGKSLALTLIYAALSVAAVVLPSLLFGGMGGG